MSVGHFNGCDEYFNESITFIVYDNTNIVTADIIMLVNTQLSAG